MHAIPPQGATPASRMFERGREVAREHVLLVILFIKGRDCSISTLEMFIERMLDFAR